MFSTLTAIEAKKKFFTEDALPLVIEPVDPNITFQEFLQYIQQENPLLKKELLQYGGILFRNFPVHTVDDYATVIQTLDTGNCLEYVGGDSPRTKIKGGVYTSTEAPPNFKIALHNELSYVRKYPSHIYFYCDIAPKADGETIIADARKVYDAIDPAVRRRFMDKGLKYVSCYHNNNEPLINTFVGGAHKSWVNVFETNDKNEVERRCRENEIAFQWHNNNWIEISQLRPATMEHPKTGEKVWFNQAHLFDFNSKFLGWWRHIALKAIYCRRHTTLHKIFFGDGTKIPKEDLYHILDVLDDHTIAFPWQKGDVLMLDNVLTMHGRNTFKGKRRILTAMTGS